jgi:hypothetical protein
VRLTKRGRVVLWTLVFVTALSIGFITAPISFDYSNGIPQVYDNRDPSRNIDRP